MAKVEPPDQVTNDSTIDHVSHSHKRCRPLRDTSTIKTAHLHRLNELFWTDNSHSEEELEDSHATRFKTKTQQQLLPKCLQHLERTKKRLQWKVTKIHHNPNIYTLEHFLTESELVYLEQKIKSSHFASSRVDRVNLKESIDKDESTSNISQKNDHLNDRDGSDNNKLINKLAQIGGGNEEILDQPLDSSNVAKHNSKISNKSSFAKMGKQKKRKIRVLWILDAPLDDCEQDSSSIPPRTNESEIYCTNNLNVKSQATKSYCWWGATVLDGVAPTFTLTSSTPGLGESDWNSLVKHESDRLKLANTCEYEDKGQIDEQIQSCDNKSHGYDQLHHQPVLSSTVTLEQEICEIVLPMYKLKYDRNKKAGYDEATYCDVVFLNSNFLYDITSEGICEYYPPILKGTDVSPKIKQIQSPCIEQVKDPEPVPTTTASLISDQRTSTHLYFERSEHAKIFSIEARVAELLQVPLRTLEPIQMVRYEYGQSFQTHHDLGTLHLLPPNGTRDELYFDPFDQKTFRVEIDPHPPRSILMPPRRLVTVFCYLNTLFNKDDDENSGVDDDDNCQNYGGTTLFPLLKNLKVSPKRGMALLFCNINRNGLPDPRVIHSGEPVMMPNVIKYGINIWACER